MAKKNPTRINGIIDCACVIHGSTYDWIYVQRLYNMLQNHLSEGVRFHVYTEAEREVPVYMVKHALTPWPGISGPRKSWWYKLQLFNPQNHAGNLLYLDLDTVIVGNLDWIRDLSTDYFWTIRDFKYLQRLPANCINSSMMWWNVSNFSYIWQDFSASRIDQTVRRFPGDQDYLNKTIDLSRLRFFQDDQAQSYRWQCLDGGYDFKRRRYNSPGTGISFTPETSVIVFHGQPKPHQVTDPVVENFWR